MRDYIGQTLTVPHFNIRMRNVDLYDTGQVCTWRNSTGEQWSAADHRRIVLERKPHDYTWIMNCDDFYDQLIGMAGLTVKPEWEQGHACRLFMAPNYRISQFDMAIPLAVLWFAFDILHLERVWTDIHESRRSTTWIHQAIGYHFSFGRLGINSFRFDRKDWKGLADWPDRIKGME